ncbi:MAG: hypothetical protein J0L65_16625 [Xanthomonadales bacterium]|nr:hypothetical protein [Xanthomonadales bacterium]
MTADKPDFIGLWQRYQALSTGDKAVFKRVSDPDELREFHALYKLFPQGRAHEGWLRAAFLLPWCDDCGDAKRQSCQKLGKLLVSRSVNESRVLQVARSNSPNDIVQFRRLMIQLKNPILNWDELGRFLYPSDHEPSSPANSWEWSGKAKRKLVEHYYLAQFSPAKGDK